MEFPYTQVLDFVKHQKRHRILPWIRVGIFNPKNPSNIIYSLGLVDSGADVSIINREIGEELEFKIEKGRKEEIEGVGGGTIKGFLHEVGFIVQDYGNTKNVIKYTDYAVFVENAFPESMPQQTAIFGTIGFFRHLMVTFVFPKQIIIDGLYS
ncbi:hypothetical protein HYZ78_03030 [Candidatus Microgenomates bacterium]|nr:hypothetical protein [Candidatus Microgenomates bacterium]